MNTIDPRFEAEVDEVDASVFSGDALLNPMNRAHLREMCFRWLREIDRHDQSATRYMTQFQEDHEDGSGR